MPMNTGGISIPITTQITGYQSSLNALRAELAKLDPGSQLSKNITRAIDSAQKRIDSLNKRDPVRVNSDWGIEKLTDQLVGTGREISNIIDMFQQINIRDVLPGEFGRQFKANLEEIKRLQQEVAATPSTNLGAFLETGTAEANQLKQVFEELKIDLSSMSATEIGDILSFQLQQTAQKAEEAQQALDALNVSVEEYKNAISLLDGRATGLQNITDFFQRFKNGTSNITFDESILLKAGESLTTALGRLVGDSTSTTLTAQINDSIMRALEELSTGGLDSTNFQSIIKVLTNDITKAFEEGGITTRGLGLANIIKSAFSQNVFNQYTSSWKNPFQDFIQQNADAIKSGGIDPKELAKKLIGTTPEAIQESIEAILQALIEGEGKIRDQQTQMVEAQQQAIAARDAKANELAMAQGKKGQYNSANETFLQQISSLQQQVNALEEKIRALTEQNAALKAQNAENIRRNTEGQRKPINDELNRSVEMTDKYKHQLAAVKQAEQALGKIQGVVQRWFSIYAAIRMVRQAINSVKNTLKELDKSITAIAIVTDKTQTELWGQMKQYTDMAKEYGVAISGVYEVSQLFYQQGLQQADVMALTEQTLKMARISGLSYSEATNYRLKSYVA